MTNYISKYNPVWLSVGPLRRKSHRTEAGATAGLQWEFFFQTVKETFSQQFQM